MRKFRKKIRYKRDFIKEKVMLKKGVITKEELEALYEEKSI